MTMEIGDTLAVIKQKGAIRYYARLVFSLLLSIEKHWKAAKKTCEKRQFRKAGKRAIDLFMYLAKMWWTCYGSLPDLSDWMIGSASATDEDIKEGLKNLKQLSLPDFMVCRLAKDLLFIRENASRGWSESGLL